MTISINSKNNEHNHNNAGEFRNDNEADHDYMHHHDHGLENFHVHRNIIGFDEHGIPKVIIKSRYALVDAGFHPETQYITLFFKTHQGALI